MLIKDGRTFCALSLCAFSPRSTERGVHFVRRVSTKVEKCAETKEGGSAFSLAGRQADRRERSA